MPAGISTNKLVCSSKRKRNITTVLKHRQSTRLGEKKKILIFKWRVEMTDDCWPIYCNSILSSLSTNFCGYTSWYIKQPQKQAVIYISRQIKWRKIVSSTVYLYYYELSLWKLKGCEITAVFEPHTTNLMLANFKNSILGLFFRFCKILTASKFPPSNS